MLLVILMAVLGLILGSFLSVLVERLDRKEGIVAGRSECPHCHHVLAWYDLIPLFSYVALAGRCRYCKVAISPLYPVLEIVMATVFGLYAFRFGLSTWWQITDLAVLFGLVALFFFDLRYQILPDLIIYPMIGLLLIRLVALQPYMTGNAIFAALGTAAFFGLLYAVSRGQWLGFGDVKLAVLMGLLFGYPTVIGVTLFAIWLGALIGIGMMIMSRANLKTALPFGSFWTAIAIGGILWQGPGVYVIVTSLFRY